jgi:hypothetical protein
MLDGIRTIQNTLHISKYRIGILGSGLAIDCYTCSSKGGSDRKCEDPVYKVKFGRLVVGSEEGWFASEREAETLRPQGRKAEVLRNLNH